MENDSVVPAKSGFRPTKLLLRIPLDQVVTLDDKLLVMFFCNPKNLTVTSSIRRYDLPTLNMEEKEHGPTWVNVHEWRMDLSEGQLKALLVDKSEQITEAIKSLKSYF